ncbi:putative holin-like toxin [Catenibacterium faecis]
MTTYEIIMIMLTCLTLIISLLTLVVRVLLIIIGKNEKSNYLAPRKSLR